MYKVITVYLNKYHPFRISNNEKIWYKIKNQKTDITSFGAYTTLDRANEVCRRLNV